MAKYTEHYQLHQWEPEDPFLRTDFNEDLNKVDQALSQLASEKYGEDKKAYVCGSYIGDGGTGMQDIALSFQPTLLYLYNCDPDDNQYTYVFTVGTQEVQCAFERSGGIPGRRTALSQGDPPTQGIFPKRMGHRRQATGSVVKKISI